MKHCFSYKTLETKGVVLFYISSLLKSIKNQFYISETMKPLLINTSDLQGGAARAAYRLHRGLQQIDIESQMFVQKKTSNDVSVTGPRATIKGPQNSVWNPIAVCRYIIDRLPLIRYNYRNFHQINWSPQWIPNDIHKKINKIDPDIVHLHWICQGFIPIQEIAKIKQPVVWTLHDMWAFTGGCHVGACEKYKYQCGSCPQLASKNENDVSQWVWKRKKRYWDDLDFTVVTPSHWLANCASSSSLLGDKRIEVIPNGLDLQKFRPVDKDDARKALKLPVDKSLILFGAMNSTKDKNKGFNYLISAIDMLSEDSGIEAIVFGNSGNEDTFKIRSNYLGYISDDKHLSLLYSAADVFVAPSLQENLSNTVMESLACGTPSVAFDVGGMSDLIVHKENGYLARSFDVEDLARGIEWVVGQDQRKKQLSEASRKYVENNFELKSVARRYADLYSEL
jgi:glycosyltransferase involved in cell wall biosynthesis